LNSLNNSEALVWSGIRHKIFCDINSLAVYAFLNHSVVLQLLNCCPLGT